MNSHFTKTTAAKISVAIVIAIAVVLFFSRSHHMHSLDTQDMFDTNRTNTFSRIEFIGQQQTVVVTNLGLLELISNSFKQQGDRLVEAGQTYEMLITDNSSSQVKVWVSIYPSLDGFAVSLPRPGLNDPENRNVSILSSANSQITNLFRVLYEGGKNERVIYF